MIFQAPINPSLSPNTQKDDVFLAAKTIVSPWRWYRGEATGDVEMFFSKRYGSPYVSSFNSGRSAFLAILKAFGVGKGDEVIIQAFTCVAVPNSILWTGATPVYADIDNTYNIDSDDIRKRITTRTKAIVVQHTFGIPADMDAIGRLAKQRKLLLIEDCAHSLGSRWRGQDAGSMGDAAFFSFGRDKALSSVFGGCAVIDKAHSGPGKALLQYTAQLPSPPLYFIIQQLLHPIAFYFILPLYRTGIGKGILVLLQKFGFLSLPVYAMEKRGKQPGIFPRKYPNALAILLRHQIRKLNSYRAVRKKATKLYEENLRHVGEVPRIPEGSSCLRYPMLVADAPGLMSCAKDKGVLLGNWYHNTIDPSGVVKETVQYVSKRKNAERHAKNVVNLPTLVSETDARKVINVVRSCVRQTA